MSNEAACRRLSVSARDREYGYPSRRSGREEHVDHVFRDVPANALARSKMHAEAWCRIDLDDTAAVLPQRLAYIWSNDVDTGNIETNDPGDPLKKEDILRVRIVGAVDSSSAR